ncbi:photosystem II protein PsbQ, partial [filamentous cyanobacterium CCP5]
VLAAIAALMVGCGGGPTPSPPTYTPDILEQVQIYAPRVIDLRQRFPELEDYIQQKDWVNIQSFIHGPMGDLRSRVKRLSATLLPRDEEKAEAIASDLFSHLERLDNAAKENNQVVAGQEYRGALDDFDAFLNLVPTAD